MQRLAQSSEYATRNDPAISVDDLIGVGNIELILAARDYTPGSRSFAGYAAQRIKWAFINEIRANSHGTQHEHAWRDDLPDDLESRQPPTDEIVILREQLRDALLSTPAPPEPRRHLTEREMDVLVCAARGDDLNETAARLCIDRETVKSHRRKLRAALNVPTITNAVWVLRYEIERYFLAQ